MSVKRYDVYSRPGDDDQLDEAADGEWVKYTSHAALVSILVEALEDLHAVQNGPPLIRDAIVWHEAMQKTEAALRAARGEG